MRSLLIIVILLVCNSLFAQDYLPFAPIGSYWIYENSSVDQNIKRIRIDRIADTTYDTIPVANLDAKYLDADSNIIYHKTFLLDIRNTKYKEVRLHIPGSLFPYGSANYSFGNIYNYDTIHTTPHYTNLINVYNSPGPIFQFITDSIGHININGKRLFIKYTRNIYRNGKPDTCAVFCGPFIERLGSIGFAFPFSKCKGDTIYAGKLLTYYDPEIGLYDIPDSLRDNSCYFHSTSTSINPDNVEKNIVSIWPNPTGNTLFLTSKNILKSVTFFSIAGKPIKTEICNSIFEYSTNIYDFPPGFYIVKIATDKNISYQKILKQ